MNLKSNQEIAKTQYKIIQCFSSQNSLKEAEFSWYICARKCNLLQKNT
jgi:hypothetical protein